MDCDRWLLATDRGQRCPHRSNGTPRNHLHRQRRSQRLSQLLWLLLVLGCAFAGRWEFRTSGRWEGCLCGIPVSSIVAACRRCLYAAQTSGSIVHRLCVGNFRSRVAQYFPAANNLLAELRERRYLFFRSCRQADHFLEPRGKPSPWGFLFSAAGPKGEGAVGNRLCSLRARYLPSP